MNSLRDQINALKEKKRSQEGNSYFRYIDVINEKLKDNKSETLLRKFNELEKNNNEWFKNEKEVLKKTSTVEIKSEAQKKEERLKKIEENIKDEQVEQRPSIEEIIKKLRELKHPKTLFGETDDMRYERLKLIQEGKYVEKECNVYIKPEAKTLENVDDEIEIDEDIKNALEEEEVPLFKHKKVWNVTVNPKDYIINSFNKRWINVDKLSYEFKSEELYNWFQKVFAEWQEELEELEPDIRKKAEGKQKIGLYRQCKRFSKPLLLQLRKKEASLVVVNKLFEVMVFCMDRDYIRANDKYLELAIGNAPWPMGVTMIGIQERKGRSRLQNIQIAHILNDETQKRYLQCVKRFISVCQRRYPTTPSKSVFS